MQHQMTMAMVRVGRASVHDLLLVADSCGGGVSSLMPLCGSKFQDQ